MAKIQLTKDSSFEQLINQSTSFNQINHSGIHFNNQGNKLLLIDDLLLPLQSYELNGAKFQEIGSKKISNVRSFRRLGFDKVGASALYRPVMRFVDAVGAISSERIYALDHMDLLLTDGTRIRPVLEFKTPTWDKVKFSLTDVLLAQHSKKLEHIIASETVFYDVRFGYNTVLYAIDSAKQVLSLEISEYYKDVKRLRLHSWYEENSKNKQGFMRLSGDYSGNSVKRERIYVIGVGRSKKGLFFNLKLINKTELKPPKDENRFYIYGAQKKKDASPLHAHIILNFDNHLDLESDLPYFDSGCEIGKHEFVMCFVPKVAGSYKNDVRDFYYFKLNDRAKIAKVSAEPLRVKGFNKFDMGKQMELPIGLSACEDPLTKDVYLYFSKRKKHMGKYRFDLV